MQTRKCVDANEFKLLFKELFNLLRNTLYPRKGNFWTISEIMQWTREEVMSCLYVKTIRTLWVRTGVGSETFRWCFGQPFAKVKDWHRRSDDEVFRVWGDGNSRAAEKCRRLPLILSGPLLQMLLFMGRFLPFLRCSSLAPPAYVTVALLLLIWGFFLSFFLSHNYSSFYLLSKYHFDSFYPFWILKVKLNLTLV